MAIDTKIVFNYDGLAKLIKENEKAKQKVVKVGVIGNTRNASILATHEFGSITKKIPRRSVLRDTLIYKSEDIGNKITDLTEKHIQNKNGFIVVLKKIGFFAEALIQEAFATGGFGRWAKNKPSTIKQKGSDSILIDTAQLRKGITSKVDNKS